MMLNFAEQMARFSMYIICKMNILNDHDHDANDAHDAHDAHNDTIKTSGIVPVGPIIKTPGIVPVGPIIKTPGIVPVDPIIK